MVNEDIVTALKNAIERGESLQIAMRVAVNSGYNPREIEEASKFVAGGTLQQIQPNPEEQLTMPEHKSLIPRKATPIKKQPLSQPPPQPPPIQQPPHPPLRQPPAQQPPHPPLRQPPIQQPPHRQIQQLPAKNAHQLPQELQEEKPKKSWTREIILFSILLILVGVLVATIIFREKILGFFSP